MARRKSGGIRTRVQHATSGAPRGRIIAPPKVPWMRGLPVDAYKQELEAANPGYEVRRVQRGPRADYLRANNYVNPPVIPPGVPIGANGEVAPGKDTHILMLSADRAEARAHWVQQRALQKRADSEAQQKAQHKNLIESKVDYGTRIEEGPGDGDLVNDDPEDPDVDIG